MILISLENIINMKMETITIEMDRITCGVIKVDSLNIIGN